MNPDQPSREEIEAKLTALLLGELPDEEARLLRWAIAQDAELGQLHDRLKLAIGLVRQVMVKPTESIPLKLSDERRKKLLAHFKTPRPKPSFWLKRIEVPSLIPVLVAVAIIALLAAMLLPALSKAKSKAQHLTLLSAQRMAMESGAENAASAPIVAAPTASAPAAVAFAPEPVLAPPPVQIVLPQPESTPDDAAQTGLPAGSGNGGVYSQKIIGYANNQLPSPPPAALPPGGVALPAVEAESGQLAFDHRETAQRNAGFQQRLEIVEKQVQMPAHAVDSSSTVREPNGGNVQNAGVVNAFAGAGGFGGFGGGGGAGGIGGSIPAQQPARMIRNGAVDQLGVEPPPPALNSLNSTTLAWSGSDVNRSPAANQPDAAGHGFSLLGPVTGSEVLQPPPGGSLSEHFPRPASPGTADTTFALRAPATAAAPLGKFPETASDEFVYPSAFRIII